MTRAGLVQDLVLTEPLPLHLDGGAILLWTRYPCTAFPYGRGTPYTAFSYGRGTPIRRFLMGEVPLYGVFLWARYPCTAFSYGRGTPVRRFLMGEVPLYGVFLWARYPCTADAAPGALVRRQSGVLHIDCLNKTPDCLTYRLS
jgi:hypothetical protein